MNNISIWGDTVPGYKDVDPSRWIRFWAKVSEKLTPGLHETPIMEAFLLENKSDTKDKRPCMIICPGGGYGGRADHEGAPVARWLNKIGYHAFVLQYRVSPYRYPYPLLDVLRAMKYVRYHAEQWNIKEDAIGLLGFSAGGHLASSAGTHFDFAHPALDNQEDPINQTDPRPDLLVLCYPVISFLEYGHEGSMRNFLGKNQTPELVKSFSNHLSVTEKTPPAFLWHAKDDTGVPYQNSEMFAKALEEHGIDQEVQLFPTGGHGIGLAEGMPGVDQWPKLCETWLHTQVWNGCNGKNH